MVHFETSEWRNPHDVDVRLNLSEALESARRDRELMPVFQWMVDNSSVKPREVLDRALNLTRLSSSLEVDAKNQEIKAELMRVLHAYTGAPKRAETKETRPEVLSVNKDGTLLIRLGSGREILAFELEAYAAQHGLEVKDFREYVLSLQLRPIMGGVFHLASLRRAEKLQKASGSQDQDFAV